MVRKSIINEHEVLQEEIKNIVLTTEPKKKYLGLHFCFNNNTFEKEIRAFYYVGICWLHPKEHYLQVNPKIENLDFLKMFMDCLSNPTVAKHFEKSYKIFFDEPLIPINSNKIDITPLLIAHFLIIIKRICKKGLKKGYVTINKNLSGQIKGKPDIKNNIKRNLATNRQDKCFCNYQIHTFDCLENRILKSALRQVGKFLFSIPNNKNLISLFNFSKSSFEIVSEIKINSTDFKNIKHSAFYPEYKQALDLAFMIFKRLGYNPQQNDNKLKNTPPFYIDMPELFERYVETKLRKENYKDLKVGYSHNNSETKSSSWELRPDFLLPKRIIDAKYKNWYIKNTDTDFKDDFQQLALYSRTKKIRNKIEIDENENPELIFIYPMQNGSENIDLENIVEETEFYKFFKKGIKLPIND
jgi:5-methylcytosine-specific restriction endonuclease McrBC regulatory subunit McrC